MVRTSRYRYTKLVVERTGVAQGLYRQSIPAGVCDAVSSQVSLRPPIADRTLSARALHTELAVVSGLDLPG